MRKFCILLFVMLCVSAALAQVELVPSEILGPDKPVNALQYETKPYHTISATGHWVSLNPKNPVAGFSLSDIFCTDGSEEMYGDALCTDSSATIIPNVGLQVISGHDEYKIVSWRSDGLTARYVGGACHIAHTLEVDFKTGEVIGADSPTAATMSLEHCKKVAATLVSYRLMEGNSFTVALPTPKGEKQ